MIPSLKNCRYIFLTLDKTVQYERQCSIVNIIKFKCRPSISNENLASELRYAIGKMYTRIQRFCKNKEYKIPH